MRNVSGPEMCRALKQKGWVHVRTKSSHHIFKHPINPATISVPVHGSASLKVGLLNNLMKVAGLTEDDF